MTASHSAQATCPLHVSVQPHASRCAARITSGSHAPARHPGQATGRRTEPTPARPGAQGSTWAAPSQAGHARPGSCPAASAPRQACAAPSPACSAPPPARCARASARGRTSAGRTRSQDRHPSSHAAQALPWHARQAWQLPAGPSRHPIASCNSCSCLRDAPSHAAWTVQTQQASSGWVQVSGGFKQGASSKDGPWPLSWAPPPPAPGALAAAGGTNSAALMLRAGRLPASAEAAPASLRAMPGQALEQQHACRPALYFEQQPSCTPRAHDSPAAWCRAQALHLTCT